MNTLREAAQQFVSDYENGDLGDLKHYARAIRAALAQQEPTVRIKCTVVDNQHPSGVPFEQWVPKPLAGMSEMNRTIAYCAAAKLRELGYEWNGQAWAALAQEEQEPVAFYVYEWVNPSDGYVFRSFRPEEHHMGRNPDRVIPVPPRCEWKSLTEDEIRMAYGNDLKYRDGDYERFARAVEAKLKEKNNG